MVVDVCSASLVCLRVVYVVMWFAVNRCSVFVVGCGLMCSG